MLHHLADGIKILHIENLGHAGKLPDTLHALRAIKTFFKDFN